MNTGESYGEPPKAVTPDDDALPSNTRHAQQGVRHAFHQAANLLRSKPPRSPMTGAAIACMLAGPPRSLCSINDVAIGAMAKTVRSKNPFAGRWRISWMEQWDQDFVDAEVEGYFKFGPRNLGSFQFGYVQGEIDIRLTSRDGKPCLEFTWEGNDEMDMACGRGWVVKNGNEISGLIFFYQGGESAFQAKKSESP